MFPVYSNCFSRRKHQFLVPGPEEREKGVVFSYTGELVFKTVHDPEWPKYQLLGTKASQHVSLAARWEWIQVVDRYKKTFMNQGFRI